MLSMSAMSAGQAGYYLGLAREDYYLQGGEPPGQWFGRGAEALRLSGQVEANQLYNLFAGRSPTGAVSLVQRQKHGGKAEHRPGWDLTFSAPKSVSTLWSQAGDNTRATIQSVHEQAVKAALGYLEDTAASTRRGKEGKRLEGVGLVAALFEHSTSRALDPQLHTHALVMNVSMRDDGTTGTLSSLDLFLSKMAAGALYRAELAKGLQEELGISLRRERSWFEIEGVSKDLVQEFSKRREAIEEALRKSGLNSAEAAAVAAVQTRTAKDGVSRAQLFHEWRIEGQRIGWSTDQVNRLIGIDREYRNEAEEKKGACERATERLTQNEAFFSERDFVRYVAEESQCRGLGTQEVRECASDFLHQSPEIVRLGLYKGEQRFTTHKMMELESDLLSAAEDLSKDEHHQLHAGTVMGVFSKNGGLSEEQLQAVWHITHESGAIAVVSGMAGTGKTRMLDVAREAWEGEGYRVIGAALAARAAKELTAGSNIKSATITRTLLDLDAERLELDQSTIIVVDEAGMVATQELRRLALACRNAGAKLVLIGDERQLQAIGPGGSFLELGMRFGRVELTENRRQSDEWARDAVRNMADGNAREALHAFAERGLVAIAATRHEAMRDLVNQWRVDGEKPENTLILAGTRNEVRILNELAQAERIRAGELGADSATVNGERIFLNDRVMFTKNKATLGIENGAKGTVCGMAQDGSRLSVRLDSGDKVTIQPHAFPHLSLGYASTTHKAQGATTLKAYVLGGGAMQGRELSYVQVSRARIETRIFTVRADVGDSVAQLARQMEPSHRKVMASSIAPGPDPGPSLG